MARWVAVMRVAASSRAGVVALLGFMAGFCAMVFVLAVCTTIYTSHDRVQSSDSGTDRDNSPRRSKFHKKWISLSSRWLLTMMKGKRATAGADLLAHHRHFAERGGRDSAVWQRSILMGERCRPPEFSGLILYDENGNPIQNLKEKRTTAGADLLAHDRHFAEGGGRDSAVWQRSILMGERCRPPAFSGLILYDENGNPIQDLACRSLRSNSGRQLVS